MFKNTKFPTFIIYLMLFLIPFLTERYIYTFGDNTVYYFFTDEYYLLFGALYQFIGFLLITIGTFSSHIFDLKIKSTVKIEHQILFKFGFVLVVIGFLFDLIASNLMPFVNPFSFYYT